MLSESSSLKLRARGNKFLGEEELYSTHIIIIEFPRLKLSKIDWVFIPGKKMNQGTPIASYCRFSSCESRVLKTENRRFCGGIDDVGDWEREGVREKRSGAIFHSENHHHNPTRCDIFKNWPNFSFLEENEPRNAIARYWWLFHPRYSRARKTEASLRLIYGA